MQLDVRLPRGTAHRFGRRSDDRDAIPSGRAVTLTLSGASAALSGSGVGVRTTTPPLAPSRSASLPS